MINFHTKIDVILDWSQIDLSSLWESVHSCLDPSHVDAGSLWESVHSCLDRSQFTFKRSHSDRFWLRSISERSEEHFERSDDFWGTFEKANSGSEEHWTLSPGLTLPTHYV